MPSWTAAGRLVCLRGTARASWGARSAEQPDDARQEGVVERGDEGGHDHDRGEDDDRVSDQLSAVGPVDLPEFLTDVLQELPDAGALPLLLDLGEALAFHTSTLALIASNQCFGPMCSGFDDLDPG